MTIYRFSAIGEDGRKRKGRVEANGVEQARQLLSSNGDLVLDIVEARKREWFKLEQKATIDTTTAAEFSTELAGLLKAGASLRKALEIQAEGDGRVAKLASFVRRDVEAGRSLAKALRAAGGAGETLAEFAAAGEAGAGLDELLATSGGFLSARNEALNKIKSALAYPLFIVMLAIIALIVMTLYVAPALAPAVEQAGQRGLIIWLAGIGEYVQVRSTFVLLGLAGSLLLVIALVSNQSVRLRLNRMVWQLPFFGSIARDLDIGQSCHVLAALLQTGRSMESSLQFASAVSGPELGERYGAIALRIRDGQAASTAFANEQALPKEVRRLALLGEQSSAFGNAIQQAGRLCHDRALRRIDRLSRVLGPVLVIGLGVGVSILMISVLGSLSSLGEVT